jgi:crotonobetainyl-CoA:carnitine CoA-transferase CaiB-like acyl-CoA transferase
VRHGERILTDVRVADLTIITAGAVATQLLADLGAEVIKVESHNRADPFRRWSAVSGGGATGTRGPSTGSARETSSAGFEVVNRNKLSLAVDLKTPDGREVFLDLVSRSDLVTENFRSGVLERLGLDYESLRAVNPRVVLISVGSQGLGGPESRYGSYGSTLEALSGLMSATGYPGGPPVWSSSEVNYPDQVAAVFATGLALAGLRRMRRQGNGGHIDISQRELVTAMIGEQVVGYSATGQTASRTGNLRPPYSPSDCFRCQGEDQWIALSIAGDEEWQRFCLLIGRPDLADPTSPLVTAAGRTARPKLVRQAVERWTAVRSKHDAMYELQQAKIRAGAVLTGAEMLADPQLESRRFYRRVETASPVTRLRSAPYRLADEGTWAWRAAPALGQHTEHVLREVLGYDEPTIDRLYDEGIVSGGRLDSPARS